MMYESTGNIENKGFSGNNRNCNDLKYINRTASGAQFCVEFRDLMFSVKDKSSKEGSREILHSINGTFYPGELSAILGPSGAGKTTLLHVLAGYLSLGVSGCITINGRPIKNFKKISAYIMEENIIQPYLTVREAMMYAAKFKLGTNFSDKDKILMVDEVINFLGMKNCLNTFSNKLSGGERKRLTIALELIGNSPILFLDEPTTGLDDFTVKQCVDLLQKISRLGKTVICTIHQPSASLFQLFDQVYMIANGFCAYNGSPAELVPFLSTVGYPCPSTHTPADYIMELVDLEPSTIDDLKQSVQNGKINIREPKEQIDCVVINETTYEPCFSVQFYSLLSRKFLQIRRNKTVLFIQFLYFFVIGCFVGVLWNGVGNDAAHIHFILTCLNSIVVFLIYNYFLIPILLYPFELKLMKREYLNGWYSLKAYYFVLTLSTLPHLILLTIMSLTIIYVMTDQPMEFNRFVGFSLVGLLVSFVAEGVGYMIGTLFNSTKGCIMGTFIMIPMCLIECYGVGYNHRIEPFKRFLMDMNFMRHGLAGLCNAVFYNRGRLRCDEIYCKFEYPETFLNFLSIVPRHYSYAACCLVIQGVLMRIAVYVCLKFRVKSRR